MQGVGGCLGLGTGPCVRRDGKSVLLEERQVEAPVRGRTEETDAEGLRSLQGLGALLWGRVSEGQR